MDVVRSSRFWIAAIICVAATVMACLHVVTGAEALAVMTGAGLGYGLGKAGGDERLTEVVTKAVAAAAPVPAAAAPAAAPAPEAAPAPAPAPAPEEEKLNA